MTDPHEIRKSGEADNAVVDTALFATEDARAHLQWPPVVTEMIIHEAEDLDSAGVVRVHTEPDGGVALESSVESGETGFDLGTMITLEREQALGLAEAIIQTVSANE